MTTFSRAMRGAGIDSACVGPEEWEEALTRYIENPALRESDAHRGKAYALKHGGEESLLSLWDEAIASVLG